MAIAAFIVVSIVRAIIPATPGAVVLLLLIRVINRA